MWIEQKMKPYCKWLLVVNATLFVAFSTHAGSPFYDELHDKHGYVRSEYTEIYNRYNQWTPIELQAIQENAKIRVFDGDYFLDPMPRVISGYEMDHVLKRGVHQRAKALQLFLTDYFGEQKFRNASIFPQGVLDRIVSRNDEGLFYYYQRNKELPISFLYGPDLIRDPSGQWRIIEDNPGFVGGYGDLIASQEGSLDMYSLDKKKYRSAKIFFDQTILSYQEIAKKYQGRVVAYRLDPIIDNEDLRTEKIFESYEIPTVTQNTDLQLNVREDGAYLVKKSDPKFLEKVGYVILQGEHAWLDPSYGPAKRKNVLKELEYYSSEEDALDLAGRTKAKNLLENITKTNKMNTKEILKTLNASENEISFLDYEQEALQSKGLTELWRNKKVGISYTPGVEFIGDKEFYIYIEDIIRFYLNEEPILKNIESVSFVDKDGKIKLDFISKVFASVKRYVIKKVDGRGGDAVWVGQKLTSAEAEVLKKEIEKEPTKYIVQKFTPLSHMTDAHQPHRILDLRVLADVGPSGVVVSDVPWGRGLSVNGNGKVNLSDHGRAFTVLVERSSAFRCERAYRH